jgi:hypothetical protein
MSTDEELVEKLMKWVEDNPEAADAPTINLTTQKEFTMREMLSVLIQEKDSRVAILDNETLEIKNQIKTWLK